MPRSHNLPTPPQFSTRHHPARQHPRPHREQHTKEQEPRYQPDTHRCAPPQTTSRSRPPLPKMSSPQSSPRDGASPGSPYLLVPNLHVPDPSVREIDLDNHPWMEATVIEDDDLMFGGKPLSTWYEEERRRQSLGSDDEEERRGRRRERSMACHDAHTHHHHHHHQHHHPKHSHHIPNSTKQTN